MLNNLSSCQSSLPLSRHPVALLDAQSYLKTSKWEPVSH